MDPTPEPLPVVDEAALDLAIEHILDLMEAIWRKREAASRVAYDEVA